MFTLEYVKNLDMLPFQYFRLFVIINFISCFNMLYESTVSGRVQECVEKERVRIRKNNLY